MAKKKVIMSACLLGEICRYDGQSKEVMGMRERYKEYEIIPFCPEAPLFGTPRERINVIMSAENKIIMTNESNKNVTALLREEIESFCAKNTEVDAIVLKSKSPSCGYKTTPLLNEKKEVIGFGNGIAADIFLRKYPDINLHDEFSS